MLTTALGVFVVVYAISAIVSAFSDPGQEQGLTPDKWDSSRVTPYVVNFLVFVVVAPVVEELTFRGLGYSLLEPLGRNAAVLWIGVAFGLAHGLLEALPILIAFGAGLGADPGSNQQRLPGNGRARPVQRRGPDHLSVDLAPLYIGAVRRAPIVLVSLAAWPIAATAQAQPGQAPTLTLKAPKATTYLHTVDFVGRLSPPAKNARVRLMRGDRLVAYGRVRADGVFKILVSIGSPGPFHAAWLTAASDEVTVRIRPRLDVELVGTQVAGAPLRLEATVTPAAAGPIRVRVAGLDRRVGSTGSLDLPTRQAGSLEIQVTTEPPPGYDRLHRELTATLRAPNLSLGTSGQTRSDLARQLAALHYAVPGFGSTFGDDLQQSVYAFQKVQGLDRTGAVDAAFWTRLNEARIPSRATGGRRITSRWTSRTRFSTSSGAVRSR